MNEINASAINDPDLTFLAKCTNEELDPLLDVLLGKDRKGRISSELDVNPRYKTYMPNHIKYLPEIVEEFKKYGGSTFANLIRKGRGVSYKEILCDVCKRRKVNFNKKQPTVMIEEELLAKVVENVWENMTIDERKALLDAAGIGAHAIGGASSTALIAILRAGGFESYKIVLIVVNYVWKLIFSKGLTLAANASISKALSVAVGPVGWVATGIWTVIDIASPAYRVTIPGVIYISGLRRMLNEHSLKTKERKTK